MIEFQTNLGNFKVELDESRAPISVKNFLNYVESGHYEGTIFHRVIDGFMVQGGGMDSQMESKETGSPIKNESANGLKNEAMTLAMARTNDPDSATCQFFINLENNSYLNGSASQPGYAVFGKVVEGEDTVQKIAKVKTTTVGFYENVPADPVVILSAKKI